MNSWDPPVSLRRLAAVAAIVALGLAASGCAQSMSEFARAPSPNTTATAYPSSADPQAAGLARPAVLTDETTVPTSSTGTKAPMAIAPPSAQVTAAEQPDAIAPAATNLNQVPAQPSSKLLTPEQKAKVIAELEALAKKQSTALGKSEKSAACTQDNLDPAHRVASATGDGGC